jgi:hypothetical protein
MIYLWTLDEAIKINAKNMLELTKKRQDSIKLFFLRALSTTWDSIEKEVTYSTAKRNFKLATLEIQFIFIQLQNHKT